MKYHQSWTDFFNRHTEVIPILPQCEILPSEDLRYRVFEENIDNIKIVLVGQDPYSNPGMAADGLAFSLKNGKIPGSLKNLFT